MLPTTECKLIDGKSLTFPRDENRLQSTGYVKGVILLVDFPDKPAGQDHQDGISLYNLSSPIRTCINIPGMSPSDAADRVSLAEDVYRTLSYGRMDLDLQTPYLGWLRMSKVSTEYSFATYYTHFDYVQVNQR